VLKPTEASNLRRPPPGLRAIVSDARFGVAVVRHNVAAAMEYRASFVTQIVAMIVNDIFWLTFWGLYFQKFPVIHGWHFRDIVMLWAMGAGGYGLAAGIFGNKLNLAGTIARGDLDYYLALPRNVLLHAIVGRTVVSAWGDVIFSIAAFCVFVHPSLGLLALFLMLIVLSAIVITSFDVLMESLAFYTGGAEGLGAQIHNGLISFSTYPASLFDGFVKVVLFTVLPAAFITYVPVSLLRHFRWDDLAALAAYAFGLMGLSWWVFFQGLKRYESGNLIGLRG
jgi:ABC-2 type transport system permease protein